VLEVTEEEEWIGELIVAYEKIPSEYRYEGALFEIEVSDGDLMEVVHQPEREQQRQERIQEKVNRLGKELSSDEQDGS
jgi:CYTH domain-containing protein